MDPVAGSQDDATHADRDSQQPQTVGQVKPNSVVDPDPHETALILTDWIRISMGADPIQDQEGKNDSLKKVC